MAESKVRQAILRRPGRPRPVLYFVPNMFTILGLCAGMTGMRFAFDGRWQLAVGFILAAAVFDGLDGRSARLLKMTSKLGEQLDSLADFISFGVAPAVIVYLWVLNGARGFGWAIALVFATCSALRLARFNAELEAQARPPWALNFFTGVPAPAAAGLALLPLMVSFVVGTDIARLWIVNAVVMLGVGLLMVSRVPTFSVKRLRIRPTLVIPTIILGVFVAVLLVNEPFVMLSLIGIAYLCSIPVSWIIAKRMERRAAGETGHTKQDGEAGEDAGVGEDDEAGDEGGSEVAAGRARSEDKAGDSDSVFRLEGRGRRP